MRNAKGRRIGGGMEEKRTGGRALSAGNILDAEWEGDGTKAYLGEMGMEIEGKRTSDVRGMLTVRAA